MRTVLRIFAFLLNLALLVLAGYLLIQNSPTSDDLPLVVLVLAAPFAALVTLCIPPDGKKGLITLRPERMAMEEEVRLSAARAALSATKK